MGRLNPAKLTGLSLSLLAIVTLGRALASALALDDHTTSRQLNNGPRVYIQPAMPYFFIDASRPDSKVLSCQTSGDKPQMFSQLRWSGPDRKDNWEELKKKHIVYEESVNSNVWFLEFKNPTPDDSGVYYCRGVYQSSDEFDANITVKVHYPIRLENCPERQFLVQGSTNGKINCRVTADSPKYSMFKDGQPVDQRSQRYKPDNDGLFINGSVEAADAGRYLFRIRSELTGDLTQRRIDVEVHSKPEIAQFKDTELGGQFHGIEGEPAELACNVSGNPQPIVYWLDPKLRNLTTVGGYITNAEKGTLRIDRVSRVDDHGDFQCVAYNNVGTTSRKVSMEVDSRPSIVSFENKTVDEDNLVTFECRSSGEPRPVFSIRKGGIAQLPYRVGDAFVRDAEIVAEGGGSNISIYRLTMFANRNHSGIHFCNASNRAGSAERIGHLFVNHKPDLSRTPPEQLIKPDKAASLTCHIRAFPEPIVTWYSNNVQIVNVESNIKTSPDRTTHIVTMVPPNIQQTAFNRYVCKAQNSMGATEAQIQLRYLTRPGQVGVTLVGQTPTTVKLQLSVPNDGGDRIKAFKYKLEGRTLDMHNPYYSYRDDRQNDTIIDAAPGTSAIYTIRNLLPYFQYRLTIRAINELGEGDITETNVHTTKPTKPDPPVIIKPSSSFSQQPLSGIPSEYQNGYLLKWSPPEFDNGDPVTKYIIKYNQIKTNALDMISDSAQQRIVEQMNERPMFARLGPLEINQRYRIQIQAENKLGISDPADLIIYTTADRPIMPELESSAALAWLVEPDTPTLIILLGLAIVLLIVIDLVFCYCFQIGVIYLIRSRCCPSKTNSVISDKNYT